MDWAERLYREGGRPEGGEGDSSSEIHGGGGGGAGVKAPKAGGFLVSSRDSGRPGGWSSHWGREQRSSEQQGQATQGQCTVA